MYNNRKIKLILILLLIDIYNIIIQKNKNILHMKKTIKQKYY